MFLGRADHGGSLRGVLRAAIILAAIVVMVLVLAPMARAAEPSIAPEPVVSERSSERAMSERAMSERATPERATPEPAASELPISTSVRPHDGCFTTYRTDARSAAAYADHAGAVRADRAGHGAAATESIAYRGPCGQPSDPYGLGSLIWRGPDWGDPALGHRT